MQLQITEKVERFCAGNGLFVPEDKVLLCLSGGADSVCLFFLLSHFQRRLFSSFGAFHLNHQIRGKAADADEEFCRRLCERFSVPFFGIRADVPGEAEEEHIGLEEAGRKIRYREADRLMKEHGFTKMALAHQQNDVAETFLFQLFRGSALTGLSSIPVKRGNIVRPILCLSREEIEGYLLEKGEFFCTDATNAEMDYTRNRLRNCVLPYVKKNINENSILHIAQAAERINRCNEYLKQEAENFLSLVKKTENGFCVPVDRLLALPEVLTEEILFLLLCKTAGSAKNLTSLHVGMTKELLTNISGKQISLPYGMVAQRCFSDLLISRQRDSVFEKEEDRMLSIPGTYDLGTGVSLTISLFPYKKNEKIPKNEYTKWFDYGKIRGTLRLRRRKKGDRIGFLGGTKSLKAVFIENKIPKEERDALWLLTDEEKVLLVPLIRSCDDARVSDTTETVLMVKINGGEKDGNECS